MVKCPDNIRSFQQSLHLNPKKEEGILGGGGLEGEGGGVGGEVVVLVFEIIKEETNIEKHQKPRLPYKGFGSVCFSLK